MTPPRGLSLAGISLVVTAVIIVAAVALAGRSAGTPTGTPSPTSIPAPKFAVDLPAGWTQVTPPTVTAPGVTTTYQARSQSGAVLLVGVSSGSFATLQQAGAWLEQQDSAFAQESPVQPATIDGVPAVAVSHTGDLGGGHMLSQLDVVIPRTGRTDWIILDVPPPSPASVPALTPILSGFHWT